MIDIILFFFAPINSIFAAAVLFCLSVYVVLECVGAALRMHRGDRFCRLLKYAFTCLSGLLGLVCALAELVMPVIFVFVLALTLFLWPAMLYRIRGDWRNRIGD